MEFIKGSEVRSFLGAEHRALSLGRRLPGILSYMFFFRFLYGRFCTHAGRCRRNDGFVRSAGFYSHAQAFFFLSATNIGFYRFIDFFSYRELGFVVAVGHGGFVFMFTCMVHALALRLINSRHLAFIVI